jgi:hypothetical protein
MFILFLLHFHIFLFGFILVLGTLITLVRPHFLAFFHIFLLIVFLVFPVVVLFPVLLRNAFQENPRGFGRLGRRVLILVFFFGGGGFVVSFFLVLLEFQSRHVVFVEVVVVFLLDLDFVHVGNFVDFIQ